MSSGRGERRTNLPPSEETLGRILEALDRGATRARAAVMARVSYRDVQRWVEQGYLPKSERHARRSAPRIPADVSFVEVRRSGESEDR